MATLTNAQRFYLRRLAHDLRPLVQVGKGGLTDHILTNIDQALTANELIKVKVIADPIEKQAIIDEIAATTRSTAVGVIGNVLMLYRRQPDPERRTIDLPS